MGTWLERLSFGSPASTTPSPPEGALAGSPHAIAWLKGLVPLVCSALASPMGAEQRRAVEDGLDPKISVQLLQGPPGTGASGCRYMVYLQMLRKIIASKLDLPPPTHTHTLTGSGAEEAD